MYKLIVASILIVYGVLPVAITVWTAVDIGLAISGGDAWYRIFVSPLWWAVCTLDTIVGLAFFVSMGVLHARGKLPRELFTPREAGA
jgi:hypothetical protein